MSRDIEAQLRGINLNLFPVFDALLRTASVTAAATALGVTQSAVSHSLRELRALLEDPILVRTGRGMEPTPRAQALVPAVRAALETLSNALEAGPQFEPTTSTRHFRLGTADEISVTLLPRLVAAVERGAPGVVVDIRPRSGDELSAVERGELDVVLGLHSGSGAFETAPVYTDTFSCLVRRDHPHVGARLTLKRYTTLGHVLVGPVNQRGGAVDVALAARGLERHVAVHTAFFLSAPEIVACTDYVLTMPTGLAHIMATRLPVRVLRPPIALDPFTVNRVWSKRRRAEPGLRWFNQQLDDAAATLS